MEDEYDGVDGTVDVGHGRVEKGWQGGSEWQVE
jgi:hypothetical protein